MKLNTTETLQPEATQSHIGLFTAQYTGWPKQRKPLPNKQVFNYNFIMYIYFTHIAASSTATDNSQTRSRGEYLVPTDNILVLFVQSIC